MADAAQQTSEEGEKQRRATASAHIVSNLLIAAVSLTIVFSYSNRPCATDLIGFWLLNCLCTLSAAGVSIGLNVSSRSSRHHKGLDQKVSGIFAAVFVLWTLVGYRRLESARPCDAAVMLAANVSASTARIQHSPQP